MSIEATEYVYMQADGVPQSCPDPGEFVVTVLITCPNTFRGIAFIEWLRDKIRADQEAAKAFGRVPLGKTWDEIARDRKAEEENRRAFVLPVINEGDPAPSADVVSIAAEAQFRIP